MISIIISSANPEYLIAIKKNIDETVGVPYEVLAVANGNGQKGICEIYNTAGAKAQYDVLCFMHEDIILHTPDWGKKVVEIMSEPEIGLLGIAGSTYKSLTPGEWALPGIDQSRHKLNLIQNYKFVKREPTRYPINASLKKKEEVVVIDGVWMCTRKDVFNTFKFDQELLKGFHGYDIDYSLSVGSKFKVFMTYEILLEHLSEGNYSEEWLKATLLVHYKHLANLPITIEPIPAKEAQRGEITASKKLIKNLSDLNYITLDKLKTIWALNLWKVLGWRVFLAFTLKILIKRY
jgi:hypothetical protein